MEQATLNHGTPGQNDQSEGQEERVKNSKVNLSQSPQESGSPLEEPQKRPRTLSMSKLRKQAIINKNRKNQGAKMSTDRKSLEKRQSLLEDVNFDDKFSIEKLNQMFNEVMQKQTESIPRENKMIKIRPQKVQQDIQQQRNDDNLKLKKKKTQTYISTDIDKRKIFSKNNTQTDSNFSDHNILNSQLNESKRDDSAAILNPQFDDDEEVSSHNSLTSGDEDRNDPDNDCPEIQLDNQRLHRRKSRWDKNLRSIQDIKKENLSIDKLLNHIRQNHPMQSNSIEWPICQSTGRLVKCTSKEIPQFLKDIGLGASLYLLLLKSLSFYFLFLSLFNLPVMFLYYGSISSNDGSGGLNGIRPFINLFQIGNIGHRNVMCKELELDKNPKKINLKCNQGKLSSIVGFGINKNKDQHCYSEYYEDSAQIIFEGDKTIVYNSEHSIEQSAYHQEFYTSYIKLSDKCSTFLKPELRKSNFSQKIISQFDDNCLDNQSCSVDFDWMDMTDDCIEEIVRKARRSPSPQLYNEYQRVILETEGKTVPEFIGSDSELSDLTFFILTKCQSDTIALFGTEYFNIQKRNCSILIVIFDFLSLLSLWLFYIIITHSISNFKDLYDLTTVESRDFTLQVSSLPASMRRHRDEIALKCSLWTTLQQGIATAEDMGMLQLLGESEELDRTIVNINFGYRQNQLIMNMKRINDLCSKIELLILKKQYEKVHSKIKKLEKLLAIHDEISTQTSESECVLDKISYVYITFKSMRTKEIVDLLFNPIENNSINIFKWCKKRCNPEEGNMTKFENQRRKWKILMDNFEGQQQFQDAEENENGSQVSVDIVSRTSQPNIHRSVLRNQQTKYDQQYKLDSQIQKSKFINQSNNDPGMIAVKTVDPEFILWQNLGQNDSARFKVRLISYLLTCCVIMVTFFIVRELKDQRGDYYKKLTPTLEVKTINGLNCGLYDFQKETAYKKQMFQEISNKNPKLPNNLKFKYALEMFCFCHEALFTNPLSFNSMTFTEFGNPNAPNFCSMFQSDYEKILILQLVPTIAIQTINVMSTFIFIFIVKQLERQPIFSQQNMSIFKMIYFQQLSCVGFVQIFTEREINTYGFDQVWYRQVGSNLCITMSLMILTSKIRDLLIMGLYVSKRFYDRYFTCSIKKKIPTITGGPGQNNNSASHQKDQDKTSATDAQDEDSDDEPNTRQLRQADLETLYTGPQIESGEKFAQMHMVIAVCFTFSSGLPFLYVIVTIYFFTSYYFNKVMLLRFYQKTFEFNEVLPTQSIRMMELSIILHMIFAIWQMLNQNVHHYGEARQEHLSYKKDLSDIVQKNKLQQHSLIIITMIAIILSIFLIDNFVYSFSPSLIKYCMYIFGKITKKLCCSKKKSKNIHWFGNQQASLSNSADSATKYQHKAGLRRQQTIRRVNSDYFDGSHDDDGHSQDENYFFEAINSENYYQEILFDYLKVFYEKAINSQYEAKKYLKKLSKSKNRIDRAFINEFQSYKMSLDYRKTLIEQQIDIYWQKITLNSEKWKKQQIDLFKLPEEMQQSTQPPSSLTQDEEVKFKEIEYIKKIYYLDHHYDESEQEKKFPNNFRCKSFIQSYNILESLPYFGVELAVAKDGRARSLLDYYDQNIKNRGNQQNGTLIELKAR